MRTIDVKKQGKVFACTAIAVWAATGSFRRLWVFALAYVLTILGINATILFYNQIKRCFR